MVLIPIAWLTTWHFFYTVYFIPTLACKNIQRVHIYRSKTSSICCFLVVRFEVFKRRNSMKSTNLTYYIWLSARISHEMRLQVIKKPYLIKALGKVPRVLLSDLLKKCRKTSLRVLCRTYRYSTPCLTPSFSFFLQKNLEKLQRFPRKNKK